MKTIDIVIYGSEKKGRCDMKNLYDYCIEIYPNGKDYKYKSYELVQDGIKILVIFSKLEDINWEKIDGYDWIIICCYESLIGYKWKEVDDLKITRYVEKIGKMDRTIFIGADIRNYQMIDLGGVKQFIVGTNNSSFDDILPKYKDVKKKYKQIEFELKDTQIGNGYLVLRISNNNIIYNFLNKENIIYS
jgi:hypothetical protein